MNSDENQAVNPCPPEWLDTDDNALLRGDAIGDTVYTHRWVLNCLYTITQGLPKYLHHSNDPCKDNFALEETSSNMDTSQGKEDGSQANTEKKNNEIEVSVLELDSEVEDAACQLWDMTVEKDVSLHLLNLEELDILQLASIICEDSQAPRLTEVTVGIVANLCCIEDSCQKILKNKEGNETLLSILYLLGSTSDVPTLCEVLRMVRLLLWHRTNRTPNTSWAACPLLKILCQEYYRNAILFLLKNSLSDNLLSSLLDLLSNFLFISLPETGLNIASLYSTEDIITSLIDIFDRKTFHHPKLAQDEKEKILHLVVMCLYSFIDTPGAKIIQNFAASNSKLESLLNSYMEHEGRVESLEDLAGDVCDHVIHVVGLSQLLIPHIRQPSLIITVGKLIALIKGETRQYVVSRSSSKEEKSRKSETDEAEELLALSEALKKRIRRESEKSQKEEGRHLTTQLSNPSADECGWLSPPAVMVPTLAPEDRSDPSETSNPEVFRVPSKESSAGEGPKPHPEASEDLVTNFKELQEVLEDYCYQLLAFWWSLSTKEKKMQVVILDVLDQCHAHEVLFILKAVRERDRTLVPRLQEQILDSGSHQRLVVLLAHMYQ